MTDIPTIEAVLRAYYLTPGPRPSAASLADRYQLSEATVGTYLRGRHMNGRPHRRARVAMASLGLSVDEAGQVVMMEGCA